MKLASLSTTGIWAEPYQKYRLPPIIVRLLFKPCLTKFLWLKFTQNCKLAIIPNKIKELSDKKSIGFRILNFPNRYCHIPVPGSGI